MDALAVLRSADVPLALVHDEYGHLDGIVTPGDRCSPRSPGRSPTTSTRASDPPCVERDDGSWLVSGAASADLLSDRLGVSTCPPTATIRPSPGFALSVLKRIPETGETLPLRPVGKFEIVDMDGRKIDKLLVSRRSRKRSEGASDEADKASS